MTEPLRMRFEVRRDPADVFRIWTADFGRWWPTGHSVTGSGDLTVGTPAALSGRLRHALTRLQAATTRPAGEGVAADGELAPMGSGHRWFRGGRR